MKLLLLSVATAALMLAAACGSDDSDSDSPTGTTVTESPGVPVGDDVALAGSLVALTGAESLPFRLEDISADGQTLLLNVFEPFVAEQCGKLVVASLDGEIRTAASDVSVVEFGLSTGHAVLSPDQSRAAYLATSDCQNRQTATLTVIGLDGGAKTELDSGVTRVWSWTDNNTIIYSKTDDEGERLWEAAVDGSGADVINERLPVDVSRDGSTLVFFEVPSKITVQTGDETADVTGVNLNPNASFLSEDGSLLLYATATAGQELDAIHAMNTGDGTDVFSIPVQTIVEFGMQPPLTAAWSAGGELLFLQGQPIGDSNLYPRVLAVNPEGELAGLLATGPGEGLGTGIRSRSSLLFFHRRAELHIAVVSGLSSETPPEDLLADLQQAFAAPTAVIYEDLP